MTQLISVGIDGKKSDVIQEHSQKEKADKQTVIDNVTRQYVSHFIPSGGKGVEVCHGLIEVSICPFINLKCSYFNFLSLFRWQKHTNPLTP